MKLDRNAGGVLTPLAVFGGALLFGYVILASRLGIPFAIPVGIVGAGAAAIILSGPVGKALARRLEGGSGTADETTGQLLGEMDELRQRIGELEERADFSERLLAQHQERSRLAEPSDR